MVAGLMGWRHIPRRLQPSSHWWSALLPSRLLVDWGPLGTCLAYFTPHFAPLPLESCIYCLLTCLHFTTYPNFWFTFRNILFLGCHTHITPWSVLYFASHFISSVWWWLPLYLQAPVYSMKPKKNCWAPKKTGRPCFDPFCISPCFAHRNPE